MSSTFAERHSGHKDPPLSQPAVRLNDPDVAARVLAPLLSGEPVAVFAVACLSATHLLLALHVLSRSDCSSSPSLLDVFVPARLSSDTTALLVVQKRPDSNPTPTEDDAQLTILLAHAADLLDVPLLDHLIIGDTGYYSFREAGIVGRPDLLGARR